MTGAVSFSLFGTLVTADWPDDRAKAIASELRARGVAVPEDWRAAFGNPPLDPPPGGAVPLPGRVGAALRSRGVDPTAGEENAVRRAVVAAVDPEVETRPGATAAVAAATRHGPVAIWADADVPDLAGRALIRSELDRETVDAVVTAGGCGWRLPHPRAVEALAGRLGVDPTDLVHVTATPGVASEVAATGTTGVAIGSSGDGRSGSNAVQRRDDRPRHQPYSDGSRRQPTDANEDDVVRLPSLAALSAWLAER